MELPPEFRNYPEVSEALGHLASVLAQISIAENVACYVDTYPLNPDVPVVYVHDISATAPRKVA